jgi:ubiquinone/menaquinone biosynthesis C-methylase UbiE
MRSGDSVFAGSIPEIYDRYLGPALFDPYAADLAHRVADLSTGAVLETAAGTGRVTRVLARVLPDSVSIVATDLNQAMLDFAASQDGVGRIAWQQADATALPFEDAQFDAVFCQFGAMFFSRQGGRLSRGIARAETGRALPVQHLGQHRGQ